MNVSEPPRLLVNEAPRLLTNDTRLLSNDARLLQNMNDGGNSRVVINDSRPHLAVVESGRHLTDKYLTGYDPYHRGHL